MIILSVNSGILTSCCPYDKRQKKTTLAEGILSSLASCHFCSTAHLSRVMSNSSVPGGQISTLSLSKWQFRSQSRLLPVRAFKPLTYLKKVPKIKPTNLKAQACMQSTKMTILEYGGDFEIEDISFIRGSNTKLYFQTENFCRSLLKQDDKMSVSPRSRII